MRTRTRRCLSRPSPRVRPEGADILSAQGNALGFVTPRERWRRPNGPTVPPAQEQPLAPWGGRAMSAFVQRVLLASLLSLLTAGCQQKMAEQPSYRPMEPCDFFADGRSERPAVPGTVARGHLHTDVALFTGRREGTKGVPLGKASAAVVQPKPGTPEAAKLAKAQYDQFVDASPFPMTEQVLEHGYERFMIYCVVCHDPLGTGQGKIVQRGYTAPPSYHIERLRKAPVGYLFAVISEGYGSMPSYREQIPVRDRWAIAGYLRALQASQHFPEAKLSDEMHRQRSRQDGAAAAKGAAP